MAVPDSSDIRSRFSVATEIRDARVESCLNASIRNVKRKIGIEAYGEIFDDETSTVEDSEFLDENATTADEEELRIGQVTDALCYYTAACLVLNTQLRLRPSGIVKKEQDSGSPAMGSGTQINNEYLSAREAREYSAWLMGEGDSLIAPYLIEQEPVNRNAWGRSARA